MGRDADKIKDKDKEKDAIKDSNKAKEKEKVKEKEKEKEHDSEKDRDRDRDRDHARKKDKKKSSKSSKRSRSRSRSRSRDRKEKKKRRRSASRERSQSKSRDRKHKKKEKEKEKEKEKDKEKDKKEKDKTTTTSSTQSSTTTSTSTSTTSTTSKTTDTSSTEPSPKRMKIEHVESKSPTPTSTSTSTPPITDEEKEKREAAESAALETDLERRRQRAREWQQQMKAKKEAEEKLAEEQAKKHAEMKEKEDEDENDNVPIKMETETSEPSLPPLTPTSDASLPPLSSTSTSSTDIFPTPSLVNKKKPGGFQFSAFGAKSGTSASSSSSTSTATSTSTPSKTASASSTVKMEIKPSKPSTTSAFDTATTKTPPPKPAVEEEIDPLDAFMASLAGSMTESEKRALAGKTTVEQEQQEAHNEANAEAIEKQHLEDEKRSEQAAARLTEGTKSVLEKITAAATSTTPSTGKKAPTRVQLPAAIPSSVTKGAEERFYNDDETMDETDLDAIAAASEEPSWLASSSTRAKKKDIKTVDHSKQNYIPFRKNFYIESRDITNMTEDQVKEYREKDLEGVKIRGVNCPRPVKEWIQCGLPSKIYDVIQKEGYIRPFPIQCQTLPIIMSGRDCIGCAKTGSGKTLAFVLPMLRHILDQPPLELTDGPIGLIMAPTRELVVQIHNETRKFAKACGLRCVCVYGGAGVAEQIANLKRGAEIIVATPGRFIDILCANSGRVTNLRRVTYVVLDEADRMFDMGFEPQIMRILDNIRPDRQTVMFSATFPTSVEKLARKALKTPIEIMIGGRSVASTNITQIVEVRTEETKFSRLLEILGKWFSAGSILIFVDRQEAVDNLFRQLIDSGYPCLALHGGMNQDDRDFTISDFKSGIRTLMVSTSVVARGLDIKDLILVINYEVPNHYEDYIHRVGRTGRGTNKGTAITFIEPDQIKHAPDLIKALTSSKQIVPADLQKMADEFNAKVASGEIKYATQGFGGKGFKFDEKEEERRLAKEQQQRLGIMAAEGLEVNMPEIEVVTEDGDKKENKEEKTTTTPVTAIPTPTGPPTPAAIAATTAAAIKAKMEQDEQKKKSTQSLLAKQLAAARAAALGIEVDKSAPVPLPPGAPPAAVLAITDGSEKKTSASATAAATAPPEKPESEMTEEERAKKRAQALKDRLTKINQEQAIQNAKKAAEALVAKLKPVTPTVTSTALVTTGPMGGVGQTVVQGVDGKPIITYFAEFEINDYPQHARWKVTHKESLREILDEFDCAITTKGSYVQPGRAPPPGERKLYLLIDGKEEQDVARCKHAVYLMVEEAAKDSLSRPGADAKPAYGKYSVV